MKVIEDKYSVSSNVISDESASHTSRREDIVQEENSESK